MAFSSATTIVRSFMQNVFWETLSWVFTECIHNKMCGARTYKGIELGMKLLEGTCAITSSKQPVSTYCLSEIMFTKDVVGTAVSSRTDLFPYSTSLNRKTCSTEVECSAERPSATRCLNRVYPVTTRPVSSRWQHQSTWLLPLHLGLLEDMKTCGFERDSSKLPVNRPFGKLRPLPSYCC